MADTFDLNTAVPPSPLGDGSAALPSPSRVRAFGTALTDNSLIGSLYNFMDDSVTGLNYTDDTSFEISKNIDLFNNIDSSYYDEVAGARNREHGEFLRNKYLNYSVNAEYLDDLGVEGDLYRVASYLVDIPLLSGFQKISAAGKLGSMFLNLNKSYTGRALLMGTAEGSFETVKQVLSPTERTEMDMLVAVVGGGVLGGIYNPLKYDKESVLILKNALTDTVNTRAVSDNVGVNAKFQEVVNNKQFNITSHFAQSESPTMKFIGDLLFHDVLKGPVSKLGFKAIEVRDLAVGAITNAFSKNYNPLYLEFMKTNYGKGAIKSHFMLRAQSDFFKLVGDIHYGIDNPILKNLDPAFIAKVEAATAKMSDDSWEAMSRSGHTKFLDGSIKKTDDYLPRRWLRETIQAGQKAGDFTRAEFKSLIKKSLQNQMATLGIRVTNDQIKKASEGFTKRMFQKELPSNGKDMYLVQEDAMRRAIDELQELLGLSDAEAALIKTEADAAKSTATKGTASATKFRTPLDLNATITTKNGNTVALKDFLDTDIQSLWSRYGNSMGGDSALRSMGFDSRKAILDMRNKIETELKGLSGRLSKEGQNNLDIFDKSMAHLLGKSTKFDPNGDSWRMVRSMNNLVRAAKLGATWFSMASELAQATHAHGVVNMFKSIPALSDLANAYRGKQTSLVYQESQLFQGLTPEFGQLISASRYEDTLTTGLLNNEGRQGSARIANFERLTDIAAEATAMLGGVKSGTAMLEYMSSIASRRKMMTFAQKGMNKKAYSYFEKFGFDKETADKIAAQINKFGSKDLNAPLLNLDKWDDNLGNIWSMGVRRRNAELIQRANLGDNAAFLLQRELIGDTPMGSLAMNLKSYMMVAYNKQLSKGLMAISRGGKDMMDTFGNWGYQAAFASTAYITKAYVMYGNDEKKLEQMLSPERIAANTFSMSTYASFIPSVIDFGAQAVGDDPIFNTYGKQGASFFAAESYIKDVINVPKTAVNFVSPWAKASQSELNRAIGTTPFGSFFLTKQLTTELTELLGQK